jgi:hypothetical protein
MLNFAIMNLMEYVNKFFMLTSGKLNFSNLGDYEFINNDYSTSFKFLTFADDKKARKIDLNNIGKDLKKSIEKYKSEHYGEG